MAEAQEQYDRYVQESLQRGQMQQVAGDKRYVQLEPQVSTLHPNGSVIATSLLACSPTHDPSSSTREELLAGLKKNWETLHHQYQGLSVVTDTAPKKARKERMEAEMKQLERDIELIERHRVIFVNQPEIVH